MGNGNGVYLTRAQREALKAQCARSGAPVRAVLDKAAHHARVMRGYGVGDDEIADIFRAVVANVEADGPLMRAAEREDTAAVIALLEAGADPNCRDAEARSPLIWFATGNDVAAVRALLEAGADVHARDDIGRTALHWAVYDGAFRMHEAAAVPVLLEAGAKPEARDCDGRTPAAFAASARDVVDVTNLSGGMVAHSRGRKASDAQWSEVLAYLSDSARAERYIEAARRGDWQGAIRIAMPEPRGQASGAERRDWRERRALALAAVKPGGSG